MESLPVKANAGIFFARGRGVIENKHWTDVESPPPPPHVCMSIGGLLRTRTRLTMNLLLLLGILWASV